MNTRNILIIISLIILVACSSSNEDQFEYQEEKVLDRIRDEYSMEKFDTLTVVHIDGTQEEILVEDAPFYGSEKGTKFIKSGESRLEKREEALMAEKKQKIKEERIKRYESFSDEELLEEFNRLREEDASFSQQMDVIIELERREVIGRDEVPSMLEEDSTMIDYDLEYNPESMD
ncbi:hypothetical protein QWY93_19050 [Echinicola jeungdonensis]|uniref:hypothetical protein n=1 Tax=Echinicola jeungdonensis TaxID=709343 RepID=UPI0025B4262D|nr:hypothetical protein [Echinicola jeungdonensis]MDN3671362.1 hypothetical protein [Echinicola jeungdonensis]